MRSRLHTDMFDIHTYRMAEQVYHNRAHRWRDDPLKRSLAKYPKRYLTIRPVDELPENPGFACRYHDTDVVTYFKRGQVRIIPYASGSTDAFVTYVGPRDFDTRFAAPWATNLFGLLDHDAPHTTYWRDRMRYYQADGEIWLVTDEPGRVLLNREMTPTTPFRWPRPRSTAATRKALKASGFDDFRAWGEMIETMNPQRWNELVKRPRERLAPVTALKCRDDWPALLAYCGGRLDVIRKEVYTEYELIEVREHDSLTNDEVTSWARACKAYAWWL